MSENESFGRRMRRLRKARDLTQEALAQQVFCATDTIKKLEQGLRRPSRQLAVQLADCFGLSGDERTNFLAVARAELHVEPLPQPAADSADQPGLSQATAAPVDNAPTNLPAQPTALIGREQQVAQVHALLRRGDVHLLTLTGPGGTGKTRLALQVANEVLGVFRDGVYLVLLAPIRDPELVVESIAVTLEVREGGDLPLSALLKRHLREKQLLLVLDNFEQILDAAPLVADLLDAAPRLKILVTSRACLQIYGECEFPVPPLVLPDPKRLPPLEQLRHYEAVRLFIERARAAKPDFALSEENAPAVAEICVRLDGLPLAIELAAVRVKVLTPLALLARLSRRLQLLTGGARNLPARQQTLRDAIAWSYELLSEAEQSLFTRLAVFAGGCTLEAVETVFNAVGNVSFDVLDTVQALVNNSLVRQEAGGTAEPRLYMLETIREYALEQLAARGEETELCAHHSAYYLELAETAQPKLDTGEQDIWLNQLEAEHDNLRAALTWALEQADATRELQLGAALWRFWEMRGFFSEGRRWLSAALDQSQDVAAAIRAVAYTGAGTMAFHQGDYAQAVVWHQQALDLYRALGDSEGVAFALHNLGSQFLQQGDLEKAMQHYVECLTLAQQRGHTRISAHALHNMGEVGRHQGNYGQAVDSYTQSLALCRTLGDQWLAGYNLTGLGTVVRYQGNEEQAIAFLKEALTLCRGQGYQELLAECFEGLAGCAARQRQGVRAARLFGAAEWLREAIGAPHAPVENQSYVQAVAIVRSALDPAAYERAWQEGRGMALEDAIAYAMATDEA